MKRFAIIALAATFIAVTAMAMLDLAPATLDLRDSVSAHLAESGVSHPVTAVLLNYRGYDTLLEIAVLLLALLAILAVAGTPETQSPRAAHPVAQPLVRLVAPLAVLVAIYLLWAGAFRPGGAFQAGAVLAAAAVLVHLVGLQGGWGFPRSRLRLGLAAGFAVFLVVAAALATHGALLEYPPAAASALILLIESGLTFSLALILAGLFLFLADQEPES